MRMFSKKDWDVLNVYSMYNRQNIEEGIVELQGFNDVLLTLQTFLVESKIEIPEYKNRISSLATKTILNCNSIISLLNGQKIKSKLLDKELNVIDIPSLFTLTRAQLENYLMFDFIYCQPKNEKEIEFRYYNWILSGLLSRNIFTPYGERAKEKKKKDLIEIRKYQSILKNSTFLNNFTEKQQKRILEVGEPRLFKGWIELMNLSGIHDNHSEQIFRILSAHAHTTGLSIITLDAMKLAYKKNHGEGHLIMFLSKLILSRFIVKFKSMFLATELKYNTFPSEVITKLEFYSKTLTMDGTISA